MRTLKIAKAVKVGQKETVYKGFVSFQH